MNDNLFALFLKINTPSSFMGQAYVRVIKNIFFLSMAIFLISCTPSETAGNPELTPIPTATFESTELPAEIIPNENNHLQTPTVGSEREVVEEILNTPEIEAPAVNESTATPIIEATEEHIQDTALYYNLPSAILTSATGLYASPNRDELVIQVILPVGESVYLMGRNPTGSHLRVVWNAGVGWIPVSFTDYSGQIEKLNSLPVFEQEPPRCAEPVITQYDFDSTWESDKRQRIAVVVDLFRSQYGDFPRSYLLLTVNGVEIESSRRPIVERGQFSLKDIVFSLPGYLQEGDMLGYKLETNTNEPLAFTATIFWIPEGCVWTIE